MNLLEILISLTIVAILSAMAVPQYQDWLLRSHRSSAKVRLLQVANALEQYHVEHHSYLGAELGFLGFREDALNERYIIIIKKLEAERYLLVAEATGQQLRDLDCLDFMLDESGRQLVTGFKDSFECW